MPNKIVHMHISKCAGTSLLMLFNQWYGNDNVHSTHSFPKQLTKPVTSGHFSYKEGYEDYKWVTFVRHPIDRLMSFYHYTTARGQRSRRNHWWDIIKDMTLSDWLESDVSKNHMTKQFSGLSPFDELTEDDAKRAYRNVHKFHFIGLQENFNVDVKRLAFLLGVGETEKIPHMLPSKNNGVFDEEETYGNMYDMMLYNYIKLLRK